MKINGTNPSLEPQLAAMDLDAALAYCQARIEECRSAFEIATGQRQPESSRIIPARGIPMGLRKLRH